MKLTEQQILHVHSMGKVLRVTAICVNDEEANAHMEKHENDAVVACFGDLVIMTNRYDRGIAYDRWLVNTTAPQARGHD